jgi:hypothetical protein
MVSHVLLDLYVEGILCKSTLSHVDARGGIHMKRLLVSLLAVMLLVGATAYADAPDQTFVPFGGKMYGEANQGAPGLHSHQTLTMQVPRGKVVDTSFTMAHIPCCGGAENGNHTFTAVPSGVYVEVGGGNSGEWGIFNIVRDPIVDDNTGQITGYKLSADLYCGPNAPPNGGCNVHLFGWIKLKSKIKH